MMSVSKYPKTLNSYEANERLAQALTNRKVV
jgi:hypothetical protein